MASLWKHPKSKYWTACYTDKEGKQVKRSTKNTDRNNAMTVALEWERVEQQARAKTLSTAQVQKVFNEVVAKTTGESIYAPSVTTYLAEWVENKRAKNAPGTVERYEHTVEIFVKHLGENAKLPITAVTPVHVERFLKHRLCNGIAPKTAIIDIKTLSTAFNRALRYGIILSNPVLAVELPKDDSSTREVFTHEQVGLMLKHVPYDSDWFTLILLGYYTGARLSDCVNMRWDNVNLKKGLISYQQKKTGKQVVIPIHVRLYEHLELMAEFHSEGFLCPKIAAKTSGGKHGLSESFKRILKRAKIDTQTVQGKGSRMFSKLTFHSLRHSFNSALANAGINQEIRMKLTGHSSAMMNNRYTHHDMRPLQNAINSLPELTETDGR